MRSHLDTVPAAYVPLYHSIRSPSVCLSICVRIVSIVYPMFNMHSKNRQQVSLADAVVRGNMAHVHFRSVL